MLQQEIAEARRLEGMLDSLIGDFPYAEVKEWVTTVDAVLPKMRAALAFYEALSTPNGNGATNGNGHSLESSDHSLTIPLVRSTAPTAEPPREARLTKAVQVATVMAEIPSAEWDLNAIKDNMVRRGWTEDTPGAMHSLQNKLSTMTKTGQVERVRIGVYRLTPEGLKLAHR